MADNNYNDENFTRFSLDDEDGFGAPPPAKATKPAKRGDLELEARDFRPVRQRRDGRTGFMGGFMYFIFVVSVSIILACVGWMAASDVLALNKEDLTAEVVLLEEFFTTEQVTETDDNGVTTTKNVQVADIGQVANALKNAGIIEYKVLFRFYSAISNAKFKIDPGTYELSTQYDYRAIVKKMQFGSDSQVRTMVTFPEGFTMKDIFLRLEENRICKYDELMECAANYDFGYSFLEGIPIGDASRLEGFLFPDTYDFYQGMTPAAAINTFLKIMHESRLTAEMYEIAEEKGLSMRDVMNIASMIEKETSGSEEDRKTIASVIFNRLKAGMALGVDATSIYSHSDYEGNPTEMLPTWVEDISDPYNTRHNLGLPPTPICNPGMESIRAVLWPETTGYYYYAVDEATETHRFFTNYADHQAFVATQSYGR